MFSVGLTSIREILVNWGKSWRSYQTAQGGWTYKEGLRDWSLFILEKKRLWRAAIGSPQYWQGSG